MNDDLCDILDILEEMKLLRIRTWDRFLSNFRVQKTMRSIIRNIEKGEVEEEMVDSGS